MDIDFYAILARNAIFPDDIGTMTMAYENNQSLDIEPILMRNIILPADKETLRELFSKKAIPLILLIKLLDKFKKKEKADKPSEKIVINDSTSVVDPNYIPYSYSLPTAYNTYYGYGYYGYGYYPTTQNILYHGYSAYGYTEGEYGINYLPVDNIQYISRKNAELDDLLNNYNIWNNKGTNIWDKFYRNYYSMSIPDSIKTSIGIDKINSFYEPISNNSFGNLKSFDTFTNTEIQNIDNWIKKQNGGNFNKYLIDMINDKLGIKIIPVRSLDQKNKKVISLCLFNVRFVDKNTPYVYTSGRKQPHFYSKVLLNAIKTYQRYLPDWILRLYIDDTIPYQPEYKESLPGETQRVLHIFMTEPNMELYHVNCPKLKDKTGIKHFSLTPVLFRYLSFFDQDINCCFIGDVDNTCTSIHAEIIKLFCQSDAKLLIFKATDSYQRPYFNGCIDNFLAGMMGFKKNQDEILNPQIWLSFFKFIDYYYKNMYLDKTTNIKNIVDYLDCIIKLKLSDNPFYYGFEESAITTVLASVINKLNVVTFVVPFYFDFGMSIPEILEIELINSKYLSLTIEFQKFITDIFKLKFNNNKTIFDNVETYSYLFNLKNAPIALLLYNMINYYYIKNKETINYKGQLIKIFEDKSKFKIGNGALPFVKFYPLDFEEINIEDDNKNKVDITSIYGNNISTKLIELTFLLEEEKFNEFETEYNQIYQLAQNNLSANPTKIAQEFSNNIKTNFIIDKFTVWPLVNALNKNIIRDMDYSVVTINQIRNIYKPIPKEIADAVIFKHSYNYISSIGEFCHVSYVLKQAGYKYFSLPFDWILSTKFIILDCLEDNFSKFLNKSFYIDNESTTDPKSAGHSYYKKNMFVHHNPRNQDDYDYFTRSVDRFRKVMKSSQKKIFIQFILYYPEGKDEYNYDVLTQFYKKFKKYTNNFNILFFVMSPANERSIRVVFDRQYDDSTGFTILRLYTKTKTNGVKFPDDDDNNFVMSIIKKINVNYNFKVENES